jgi:hypothetical protein
VRIVEDVIREKMIDNIGQSKTAYVILNQLKIILDTLKELEKIEQGSSKRLVSEILRNIYQK